MASIIKKLLSKIPSKVTPKELEQHHLVMTLLVRDEADIVRQNIDFHLAHGVDFIIATDNGSVDGTRDILIEYQQKGLLHLIDEPSQGFAQAEWVNRMGQLAYEKFGATIIFHNDADEFWFPSTGNLKTSFQRHAPATVQRVKSYNIILEDKNGEEVFPDDAIYMIQKVSKKIDPNISNNRYLKKTHRKVMYALDKGYLTVSDGNHRITNGSKAIIQVRSSTMRIYHFPSRGKDHFYRKVINGGAALAQETRVANNVGSHWRKWYKAHEEGELEEKYRELVFKPEVARKLMKKGFVKRQNKVLKWLS